MAAMQALNYMSAGLVLSNDVLLALNIWILSASVRPDGHSISWMAAVAVYGVCETFYTFVLYIQQEPISAAGLTSSGAAQLLAQLLMVIDKLRRSEKEQQQALDDKTAPAEEKTAATDVEQAGQKAPPKVGKWSAKLMLVLPIYFVATMSAATVYLHESIQQGREITGRGMVDIGIKVFILAMIVCSQGYSCWIARKIGRGRWFAGEKNVRLGVEGVMLVLLMRFVSRWLVQISLVPEMSLTWPPLDLAYEVAGRYGWMW